MSRAFVREGDGVADELPERPVSPHPNLVTPRGFRLIEERVRELECDRENARKGADKSLTARIERDLRYWQQRRATAQPVEPGAAQGDVRFGTRVTLRRDDGTLHTFTLVGEDEADPASGSISWMAPVAKALFGHRVGDEVSLPGYRAEVISIETCARS